jgi:hypothetical protein
MKTLQISNFRRNKEKNVVHVNLKNIDRTYIMSVKYIERARYIISEKAFPGDDTDYVTLIEERKFEAEVQSNEQLQIIHEINSTINPVLRITYDNSGSINKLETIEFWEKSSDLIDVENKMNTEFDLQDKDYYDYLDDFYNGE